MNFVVPIYAEEVSVAGTTARPIVVRPLFLPGPGDRDESVQRATTRLARMLRRDMTRLARSARHELLAAYGFYPPLEDRVLNLTLSIGNRSFQVRHLFVLISAFERRLVWTPSVPDLWFELARGEDLEQRARESLVEHYKLIERRHGASSIFPTATSIVGKAWITSIEISLDVPSLYTPPEQNIFAFLGALETHDGAAELEKVGHSLNSLYPDELKHATKRETEVAELTHLLGLKDNRPVLLVGKRLVGKTTIIHEFVRRRMQRRRSSDPNVHATHHASPADLAGDLWLISPQRLISGMAYVGQWEGRLLAILKEAGKQHHTLYFDDLVGLFSAGRSSGSSLSVAHVLKPFIERREVRVVGEITPEALRVLQELDRSFVDLFKILPVREPTERENLETLLGYRRLLEQQTRCRFRPEVLTTAIDLTRRYVPDAAFPGKAAAVLQTLATRHRDAEVTRDDTLSEFSVRSGLNVSFLDDRVGLEHEEVVKALSREVIGQRAAVASCADALTIAKARLNDPARPIASFLFLGPTGVGKTQCAKSLAKYLFGDSSRILRFDMNEFAGYTSVARLIGTFDAPEGLLTSAVRREPFSVVLFDEIEKAHPAFFDLLLGVMGDARLTDARGHSVNFANTIIILTSNLGAQEAATDLGFRQTNHSDASVYRQAAEKFFKPEFFNRLTRVVPFERLRREDVREIAGRLMQDVLKREGLLRRGVKLIVETAALNLLAEAGYHPQLGARALKRTLERQVTAPIAAKLCATPPDQPLVIFLRVRNRGIGVDVCRMTIADAHGELLDHVKLFDTHALIDRVEDALERIEDESDELHPRGEIVIGANATTRHLHQFLVRDQARRVERMISRADERLARQTANPGVGSNLRSTTRATLPGRAASAGRSKSKRQLSKFGETDLASFDNSLFNRNLYNFLHDCATESIPYGDDIEDYMQDLVREIALLDALWTRVPRVTDKNAPGADGHQSILLTIASLDEQGRTMSIRLRDLYRALFEKEFGCSVALVSQPSTGSGSKTHGHIELLRLDGPLAGVLAPLETGTHLFVSPAETYVPLVVSSRIWDGEISSLDLAAELPPVLRIYSDPGVTLDIRSRLLSRARLGNGELRAFILSALEAPRELSKRF